MSYRVAFASIDGSRVDQHFGSARYFQVYDIDGSAYHFIETRKTPIKSEGHSEGKFEQLLETLSDCDAVFVSQIGQSAAEFMIERGKRIFEAEGAVEAIIGELAEKNLFEEDG